MSKKKAEQVSENVEVEATADAPWGSAMQTATASSTAESETVAVSYTIRRESLPIQTLFLEITGRFIPIVHRIDNTQAIRAIEVGYSKKLR